MYLNVFDGKQHWKANEFNSIERMNEGKSSELVGLSSDDGRFIVFSPSDALALARELEAIAMRVVNELEKEANED